MEKFPIVELVVKIASRCNLNCTYCYEYNMGDDSWKAASKFMSIKTAEILSYRVQEHINEFGLKEFTYGLHGGEPLLMSPDKLDLLVSALKSKIDKKIDLNIGLQTNAVLMSERHIEVFKKHRIYISVSLDGIEKTHNKHRVDLKGKPSFHKVLDGINLLRAKAPDLFVGILSVIDIESDPIENFDFLSSFNVDIDFLLPLNSYNNPPFYPNDDPFAYGKFYFDIYKEWVNGRNSHINVRFLKNIITQFLGGNAIYEVMTYNPVGLITIGTDGFIEGLDCLKSLGNYIQITNLHINKNSFSEALDHEIVRIRQTGVDSLHKKCKSCEYLNGCSGGYFPNRFSKENLFNNPSVFCNDLFWLLQNMELDLKKRILNESIII